jgi:hypothetical protein
MRCGRCERGTRCTLAAGRLGRAGAGGPGGAGASAHAKRLARAARAADEARVRAGQLEAGGPFAVADHRGFRYNAAPPRLMGAGRYLPSLEN